MMIIFFLKNVQSISSNRKQYAPINIKKCNLLSFQKFYLHKSRKYIVEIKIWLQCALRASSALSSPR